MGSDSIDSSLFAKCIRLMVSAPGHGSNAVLEPSFNLTLKSVVRQCPRLVGGLAYFIQRLLQNPHPEQLPICRLLLLPTFP